MQGVSQTIDSRDGGDPMPGVRPGRGRRILAGLLGLFAAAILVDVLILRTGTALGAAGTVAANSPPWFGFVGFFALPFFAQRSAARRTVAGKRLAGDILGAIFLALQLIVVVMLEAILQPFGRTLLLSMIALAVTCLLYAVFLSRRMKPPADPSDARWHDRLL